MLDETDPQRLVTASLAMAHISAVVERQLRDRGAPEVDPKIVTAVVVSAVPGWRFFQPFIMVGAQLDNLDEHEVAADVVAAIRSAARRLVGEEMA